MTSRERVRAALTRGGSDGLPLEFASGFVLTIVHSTSSNVTPGDVLARCEEANAWCA